MDIARGKLSKLSEQLKAKGEGEYVVDNSCGSSGVVVDRRYWWHRWQLDSLAARNRTCSARNQSSDWPTDSLVEHQILSVKGAARRQPLLLSS